MLPGGRRAPWDFRRPGAGHAGTSGGRRGVRWDLRQPVWRESAAGAHRAGGGRMVKLTAELIEQAAQYTNAVRDRELDLRGESADCGAPAARVPGPSGPGAAT